MEIDEQFQYGHLFLYDRKCRSCGEVKNLIEGFYKIRKSRGPTASSYSYECKECTIKRVVSNRMISRVLDKWEYPDW